MKTLFISLITIGLVSLGHSQSSKEQSNEVKLKGVTITPLNLTYLNSVAEESMPEFVKNLQNKAARFDITESSVYDRNFESYEVMFSQDNGSIIAVYDDKGRILQSTERFHDITLPYSVRNKIYERNPGWIISKDAFLVSFYHDTGVEKSCRVQLVKDGKKKNIRIDMQGDTM